MSRHFKWLFILGVAAAVLAAGVYWNGRERAKARNDLLGSASLISLGDTSNEVATAFKEQRSSYLSLYRENSKLWRIQTPLEIGAKNWTLIILFDAQSRVAAIGFRTVDSDRIRRAGAPEDRISPGSIAAWASRFN